MNEERDISSHIAVIGMDGRFPGAKDLNEFWANLVSGQDSTRELSDEELLLGGESRTRLNHPDYVRRCAFLDDIDKFDARFFGFAPRDAAVMDPQHRLFLEVCWGAVEDAGYDCSRMPGPVGVFAGSGMSHYAQFNVFTNHKLVEEMGAWLVRHTANDRNFLSTLVSYKMNITGPSMNIQTACSSALVAIHMACQSLLNRECDFALAGGATISFPQRGYVFEPSEILSSDGRCRAFDAESNGTVFGSGIGAVVLRRLEDALADGDVIDAVICGSAINNDGSNKVGFLAPSVEGQTDAILQALEVAQVDPKTISYVETHGTGTVMGDPIEVTALRQAYFAGRANSPPNHQFSEREGTCGIGSVKSNIGHLGEAAGVAGLIKVCLALRHGMLPASLHYTRPNPGLLLEESPIYVVEKNQPWARSEQPRRAGVTALGAGGTNAHLIVEEPPLPLPPLEPASEEVLLLSAKTPSALDAMARRLAAHLRDNPELALSDVAFTLREGRSTFGYRRAIHCSDPIDATKALEASLGGSPKHPAPSSAPRLTFMFPGGGAQYSNMGRKLYESEPVYRAAVDECARHASPLLQADIRELMYCPVELEEENGKKLQSPRLSLPTLFATSYALAKLLFSWGIQPDAMIGHSMGEYVAACLAEVFSVQDALALVIERGRLFEQVEEGAMLAMGLSEQDARPLMEEGVGFAAINAPSLTVASGTVGAIDALQKKLEELELDCTRVRIRVAAHSALLDPILPAFRSFCEKISFQTPTRPLVSNLTGSWVDPEEIVKPEYWVKHLRSTVQFARGLQTIFQEGETVLLEVGPGRTLASVATQQGAAAQGQSAQSKASQPSPVALPTLRHPKESIHDRKFLFDTLGKMWAAGREIPWTTLLHTEDNGCRVHLPSYPFEGESHWIDAAKSSHEVPELTRRADVGDWFHVPTWQKSPVFAAEEERTRSRQWLIFSDQVGVHGRLGARLNGRVVSVRRGLAFSRMDADVFEVNPSRSVDFEDLLSSLDMDRGSPLEILYLWPITLRSSKWVNLSYENLEECAFNGLLSLLQAVSDLDWRIRVTVVGNGIFSLDGERTEPAKALSLGPVRVGAREIRKLSLRLIDWKYDPVWDRFQESALSQLLDEVVTNSEEAVVALRDGSRFSQSLASVRLPSVPGDYWPYRRHGTYLITGAFGGIGRELAQHLASRGAGAGTGPTLILLGRHSIPPRDQWENVAGAGGEAGSRCAFLLALEARGARVIAECVDLLDDAQVEELLRRHTALSGIFHAAGVLDDAPIQAKTHEAAALVLRSKARVAAKLARSLDLTKLDFFILFSSSSSQLGLPGQIDYTAANAMLDSLAADLRAQGHENVYSINWGTWRDVGMAARMLNGASTAGALRSRGKRAASPGASLESMPSPQGGWWTERRTDESARYFERAFSADKDWLLSEHRLMDGPCVMPGTGYVDLLFAALGEFEGKRSYEVSDLLFLQPCYVSETQTLSLCLEGDSVSGEFEFVSGAAAGPHVVGHYQALAAFVAAPLKISEIAGRCSSQLELQDGFLDQDFVDFGQRWGNIVRLAYGPSEALLEIALSDRFVDDLASAIVHPAMLDTATGGAQLLIDDFDQAREFFVPFSYGKIRVLRRFPPVIFSHVLFRGRHGDTASFDVTLADKNGDVLAVIESFLMKRVEQGLFSQVAPSGLQEVSDPDRSRMRSLLSQGTTTEEGMDVLTRVLFHQAGPQIFATPVDMRAWIAQTDAAAAEAETEVLTFSLGDDRTREEPATLLERELLEIWSELLGVDGLGVLDDFFEMGGQSLVAARMFVRIRKKYGITLPLSALFAAPTIRALAHQIDPTGSYDQAPACDSGSSGVAEKKVQPALPLRSENWSPVVAIQAAGHLPPFFCAPGMGGNPLGQRFLAERLGRDQPFYGLQARGVDGGQEPHTSVEEMAAEYIRAIQKIQPSGPYYLGGFSGGGVVSFEMAQQLRAQGESIGLLALLDAYNPLMDPSTGVYRLRAQVARSREKGLEHVAEVLKWKVIFPLQRAGAFDRLKGTARREGHESGFETERATLDHKMMSSWIAAERRYRPRPYAGDAVLFRSRWDVLHGRTDVLPHPQNGWDQLVQGELEVIDVPGTHDSFLLEPNVRRVAQGLAEKLQAARKNAQGADSRLA